MQILPAVGSVIKSTSVKPAIFAALSVSLFWACWKYAGTVITAEVICIGPELERPRSLCSAYSRMQVKTWAETSNGRKNNV